ncbi:MAG: hypothetical protein WAU33_16890 [Candidatus Binataceae bacterium]
MNQVDAKQTLSAVLDPGDILVWAGASYPSRMWRVRRYQTTYGLIFVALILMASHLMTLAAWTPLAFGVLLETLVIFLPIAILSERSRIQRTVFGLSKSEAIRVFRAPPLMWNQVQRVALVTSAGHPVPIKILGPAAISFGGRFAQAESAPDGTRQVEKVSFEGLDDAAEVYKIAVEAQSRLMASTGRKFA